MRGAKKVGLKINSQKKKLMRLNNQETLSIKINNENVEEAKETCLQVQ